MKQIYTILLILICFLIILNYNKIKKFKKIYQNEETLNGGGILENFNNKTKYFKIKPSSSKKIVSDTKTLRSTVEDDDNSKTYDVPNPSIWEIKTNGSNYIIKNTENQQTIAYKIEDTTEDATKNATKKTPNNGDYKEFKYNNNGYSLKLVRNNNVFNIYFEDSSSNNLGKMYLIQDNKSLIAKSETQLLAENKGIKNGEFIIEPYRLNLFNETNEIINHYENFVNYFNYEKFKLSFSLDFNYIIVPSIYNYNNNNLFTNNTERYNIYPTNWIAGPNSEIDENGVESYKQDKAIDPRYKNLYNNENKQLIISDKNKNNDVVKTSKGISGVDKNNKIALWIIKYNDDADKTYSIKNILTNLSILNNIIENSLEFFKNSNYMSNKTISITEEQKNKIYFENINDKKDYYNLSFYVSVSGETDPVKMYISTSNWNGMLVARKAGGNTFTDIDKIPNSFILKTNEIDERIPEKIQAKQNLLGLTDKELNYIIPNTVKTSETTVKNTLEALVDSLPSSITDNPPDNPPTATTTATTTTTTTTATLEKKGTKKGKRGRKGKKNIQVVNTITNTVQNTINNVGGSVKKKKKYLPLKHNYLRDYVNNLLYKKYYANLEFENKEKIIQNLNDNIKHLNDKIKHLKDTHKLTITELNNKLEKILKKSPNIEKTIEHIQYIFNIRKYSRKINHNDPVGNILTIGNNMYNTHNFIIKIIKKNTKNYLVIGFINYINNIEIPLDKIKTETNKFPSLVNFELEYKKPYLNILIHYLKKKNGKTEKIKGYLDINGNIKSITNISSTSKIEIFKNNNSDINYEIYFPAYLNPWFSVGTNDNINVIKKENIYSEEGFLNKEYRTNKTLKNIKYETRDSSGIYKLGSLKKLYTTVNGVNNDNNFNFSRNNTLILNIKLKSNELTTVEGDLFDIKTNKETLKISIKDNELIITEHDIKYINDDKTYNQELNHNNIVNTICRKKIELSSLKDIRFDFIPVHNQYNLTIHNGNNFIDYIQNIDLSELSRNAKINNRSDKIKLDYKIITNNTLTYILPNISTNILEEEKNKWIIGNPKKWVQHETNLQDNTCWSENMGIDPRGNIGQSLEYCTTKAEQMNYNYVVRGISGCHAIRNCNQQPKSPVDWSQYLTYVKLREASLMATNYFGTKIKNNFYKSNRIDNLTLKITSETQEDEEKLNPQTVLWSKTYNNEPSDNWDCGADCTSKMIENVKNKFLEGTNQNIIYEFNQPINISFLKINTDIATLEHDFEYWSEKENKYISLKSNLDKNLLKSGMKINLKGIYNDKYLSPKISEGAPFTWLEESELEKNVTWIFEFDDTNIYNGMSMHIKSEYSNSYLGSNSSTSRPIIEVRQKTVGDNKNWNLHWDNELINGAKINLESKHYGNAWFDSNMHQGSYYNWKSNKKTSSGWIIEFAEEQNFEEKYAYKFKFKNKSASKAKIYNTLMYGSLLRTYPSFYVKNVGIGLIKSKNNKQETDVFVNYIKDKYGTWIKVGIFKPNAGESIKELIKTTHNLSINTDQNINSAFSADFGNMRSSEVRILGATDYENWEETRTVDWVYKVPKINNEYKQWKNFFEPINPPPSRPGLAQNSNIWGFDVDGAYDGRGRWINDKFSYVHVSSKNKYKWNTNIFLEEGGDLQLYSWHETWKRGTGQLYVKGNPEFVNIGTTGVTSGFGMYDYGPEYYNNDRKLKINRKYFFDINYNTEETPHNTKVWEWPNKYSYSYAGWKNENWAKQKVSFQSAVWVLLKVNEEDLKIVDPNPDVIKEDLTKQIKYLNKNNIKIQNQINKEKELKEKNTTDLEENNIINTINANLNTLYKDTLEFTNINKAITKFNNENNDLIDNIENEFQKIVRGTGQSGYVFSKYFDKIYTYEGNNINFNINIENFSYDELMNNINIMKNDINKFKNNQIKWDIKDIMYAASIDGYVGVHNSILKNFKAQYDSHRGWKVSGTNAGINFFMIPKTVDWGTGTIEEFQNKFNTWNRHVGKIKNNPAAIPVNRNTQFKYIHGRGSSWPYTFRDEIDWLRTPGTLTDSNMRGRYLTYPPVLQLIKTALAKKPSPHNGFLLAARNGSLMIYNSNKPSWATKGNGRNTPAKHNFQAVWYFPFDYKQYNTLKVRIDWGYRQINARLALMRTVLANLKLMFERYGREIDEIETKIIEYRNVVIEKRKKDLEKNILQNDLNIQNFTNEINESELKIEDITNKLNTIN